MTIESDAEAFEEAVTLVDRYRDALSRAYEQLSKFDGKGPKQVGRAMLTIENALGLPRKESNG